MAIAVILIVVVVVLVVAIAKNFSRPQPPALYKQDPYAPVMPGPMYVDPINPIADAAAFVAETVFDALAGGMDGGGFDGGGGFDTDF